MVANLKNIYIYGEMVYIDKYGKMIKISEKVDKPTLTTDSIIFRSLLKTELRQNENAFF